MKSKIKKCISSSVENFTRIFDDRDILDQIERIVLLCIERYKSDNKILFFQLELDIILLIMLVIIMLSFLKKVFID